MVFVTILYLICWRIRWSHNVNYIFLVYNTHPWNLGWKVWENRPSTQRILVLLVILYLICWCTRWRIRWSQNVYYMFLVYNTHPLNLGLKVWENRPTQKNNGAFKYPLLNMLTYSMIPQCLLYVSCDYTPETYNKHCRIIAYVTKIVTEKAGKIDCLQNKE